MSACRSRRIPATLLEAARTWRRSPGHRP
jgi:hypothetical protein